MPPARAARPRRRVIRTAHDMGMATVVVYADSDANAPFVREADTAIASHHIK